VSAPQLLSPDLIGAAGQYQEACGYYGQVSYVDTVMLLSDP
jgi:hypothetical protein